MLEELGRHILVDGVFARQLQRHREHGVAVEGHPRRAVGLLQVAARWQWLGAVEDANVVEAEKAPGEEVAAVRVLTVDPPGEIEQQLLEDALEEEAIAPTAGAGHLVDSPA